MAEPRQVTIDDRVRILRGNHRSGPYQHLIGQEGTIVHIARPRDRILATIRFEDDSKFCCFEDEMELVLADKEKTRMDKSEPLVDALAKILDVILNAMKGDWFVYTKLPGIFQSAEDDEQKAQKLIDRAYALLARHKKEMNDG